MNDHFEEKGKPWSSFDFIYSGMWGIININSINYSFWYTLQFLHFKRTQISLSYLFKTLLKNLYFWIWNITSQWMLFFLTLRRTDGTLCLLSTEGKRENLGATNLSFCLLFLATHPESLTSRYSEGQVCAPHICPIFLVIFRDERGWYNWARLLINIDNCVWKCTSAYELVFIWKDFCSLDSPASCPWLFSYFHPC